MAYKGNRDNPKKRANRKIKQDPKKYLNERGTHHKFGKIKDDGIIEVPNRLTLKWIPNYYFSLTEKQSTMISYSFTLFFCIVGLFLGIE